MASALAVSIPGVSPPLAASASPARRICAIPSPHPAAAPLPDTPRGRWPPQQPPTQRTWLGRGARCPGPGHDHPSSGCD
uniref:Uncharacterized protein n=1 Tax=Arundo donax TaxID=35708 RepID=A0A0A8ZY80_ARUDO